MTTHESRAAVGLRTADARPLIPGPIRGTTVHYNGPAMGLLGVAHERCRAAWRGIQDFHMGPSRGWSDIAYTMAACPAHGILMAGRGAGVRTAANGTASGNDQWYAIMALLGQGEQPTAALYRAIVDGAKMLDAPRLVPHSWHKPTGCPGDPLRGWIDDGAPVGAGEDDTMTLTRGDRGPAVGLFMAALAAEAEISGRSGPAGRGMPDSVDPDGPYGFDGIYGSEMEKAVRAYQRGAGVAVTGDLDGVTTSLLVRYAPMPRSG